MKAPEQPEPVNADAGATSQKAWPPPVTSILPKTAQAQDGYQAMNTSPRFLLQDLVKQAQASAMDRARIAKEAARQMKMAAGECDDPECAAKNKDKKDKTASATDDGVSTDYAMKLANAVEFVIPHIKEAAETTQEPGKGPGALPVTESNVSGTPPGPGQQGKATPANTPPTSIGTQKSTAAGPSTQVPNTINEPPGGGGTQQTAMPSSKGKTAEAVYAGNLEVLKKMAGTPKGDPSFGGLKGRDLAAEAGASLGAGTLGTVGGLGGAALGGLAGAGLGYLTGRDLDSALGSGAIGAALGGYGGLAAGSIIGSHAGHDLAAMQHDVAPEEYKRMLEGRASGALKGQLAGAALGGIGSGIVAHRLGGGDPLLTGGVAALGGLGGATLGHLLGGTFNQERYHPSRDKEGSAPQTLVDALLATVKQAEDALNPAQISAGKAVEPDASASEEAVPPKPAGSDMVSSNQGAIDLTKQQAKAEPKRDMSSYVSEPALSSSHDSTLQQAFSHTGEAGVKMSSATAAMQVSRARDLLESIAAAASK